MTNMNVMAGKMTLEKLALMVGAGFEEVNAKFAIVDERFRKLEERMDEIEERMEYGFRMIDQRFKDLEKRIDERFNEVGNELALIHKILANHEIRITRL